MADDFGGITRRDVGYLMGGGLVALASGILPQYAFSQEGPRPEQPPSLKLPYAKDLSTAQAAFDTFYAAVNAVDIDGLLDIVAPNFRFREGSLPPEKMSTREELLAFLTFFAPLEMRLGGHVIKRDKGVTGDQPYLYVPPLSEEEIKELKSYPIPFSTEAEVDDFNKMRDVAIACGIYPLNLTLDGKKFAQATHQHFLSLKKEKEETWKIFSAQSYFRTRCWNK